MKITKEYIINMSYTDFIGTINQWNVPPGSYNTLSKWKLFSNMDKKSNILEIACTTGFSSRELSLMSKCAGHGFDLSEKSILMAKYNIKKYAPNVDMSYSVADGYKFKSNQKFSHIIVGASLGFFPDSKLMLKKCINLLKDNGYILASPFYGVKPMPKNLVARCKTVFGINPTSISYKQIMNDYRDLEILFEEHNNLIEETEEEIDYYCKCTIDRACKILKIIDTNIQKAMYDRLFEIKATTNALRSYQKYNVLVLRYRKDIYPNRFTELF